MAISAWETRWTGPTTALTPRSAAISVRFSRLSKVGRNMAKAPRRGVVCCGGRSSLASESRYGGAAEVFQKNLGMSQVVGEQGLGSLGEQRVRGENRKIAAFDPVGPI